VIKEISPEENRANILTTPVVLSTALKERSCQERLLFVTSETTSFEEIH
jgi:hypothetical protein